MAELQDILDELARQTELMKTFHQHDEELFEMRKEEYERRKQRDIEASKRDEEFFALRKEEYLLNCRNLEMNKMDHEMHMIQMGLNSTIEKEQPEKESILDHDIEET
jgi:hypothetical protein